MVFLNLNMNASETKDFNVDLSITEDLKYCVHFLKTDA